MVLIELGAQIGEALKKLQSSNSLEEDALDSCLKEISAALLTADVNVRYVSSLRANVKKLVLDAQAAGGGNPFKIVQKSVVEELVRILTPNRTHFLPKKSETNLIMFVGLQGAGKTTTCAKVAHYYKRKGFRPAIISADTYRAGAYEQTLQNCAKLEIPFYGSQTETDAVKVAMEGVEICRKKKCDLIILDTSGRHRQAEALFDEMKDVAAAVNPDEIVYVMDSHIGQACFEQAKAFNEAVNVASVIVTKLDGHAKGGGALSAVAATKSPILFIGTGETFHELEPFEARGFVQRLLGLGDISGLLSTVRDAVPAESQQELTERLMQGKFTFRDMREQFNNVLNMGPMSRLMSMIPGMQGNLIPKGQDEEGLMRIKRFVSITNSMSRVELDGEKALTEVRVLKIARGSGCDEWEVRMLIEQHREFKKLISQWSRLKISPKSNDMQRMMRNPNQMMQRLQAGVPPQLLKQMGGSGGMMKMLQEMNESPDFKEMMQQGLAAQGAPKGGRKSKK